MKSLVAVCCALAACGDPLAPVAGTIEPFAPPAVYGQWWAEMEVCSGRTLGDRAVRWYRVQTDTGMVIPGLGDRALGFWRPGVIYLAAPAVGWRATVAHEMLHELLRDGSHASPLFETCFTPRPPHWDPTPVEER